VDRDLTAIRAVETAFAAAIVWALYVLMSSGVLTDLSQEFGSWYSSKAEGVFAISVIDTSIKAPRLDRESLPLPRPLESATAPGEALDSAA